jgi:hypothetical protein
MADRKEASRRDSEEQGRRAEVSVGDPDIVRFDKGENLRRERSFLCVSVFTRDHVGREHQRRIQHDQRVSWKRTRNTSAEHAQSTFRGAEVIAVDDPHPVVCNECRQLPARRCDHGRKASRRVADQRTGDLGLHAIELVVQRRDRHRKRARHRPEGGMDRWLNLADDHTHQSDHRRKQQLARVLRVGMPRKQLVESFVR